MDKKKHLLSSWKEISNYLDCNLRTAMRWEKKYGLPVKRIGGEKSRVHAFDNEIDRWLEESGRRATVAKDRVRHKNRMWLVLIAVTVLVILVTAIWYISWARGSPTDFRIEASVLIVLDNSNRELWRFDTQVPKLTDDEFYRSRFQKRRYDSKDHSVWFPLIGFFDLDGDGKREVLFTVKSQDRLGAGIIYCFDYKGKMLWERQTGQSLKYGNTQYSSDFDIIGFECCDLNNDMISEVIIISYHFRNFPTQLLVLDHKGKSKGEYWNSGRFTDFVLQDLNGDGYDELIVAGMNNEFNCGSLVVFDTSQIRGTSPQTGRYKCEELPRGSEIFYLLFPRTDLDETQRISTIPSIQIDSSQTISCVTNFSKIYFNLDFRLELKDIQLSHSFDRLYSDAHTKGLIEGDLSSDAARESYKYELAQKLRYWDGKKWDLSLALANPWPRARIGGEIIKLPVH
jgi:hypothetical protein